MKRLFALSTLICTHAFADPFVVCNPYPTTSLMPDTFQMDIDGGQANGGTTVFTGIQINADGSVQIDADLASFAFAAGSTHTIAVAALNTVAGSSATSTFSTVTYTAPPPPACVYTYSEWGPCQPNGTQTRTVASVSPSGCVGTPDTTQSCTYAAPSLATPVLSVSSGYLNSATYPTSAPEPDSFTVQVDTKSPVSVAATKNADGSVYLRATLSSIGIKSGNHTIAVTAKNASSGLISGTATIKISLKR